jgi:CheY-like chemotaxis protein
MPRGRGRAAEEAECARNRKVHMSKRCFVIMPFSETSPKHTEDYWTHFFTGFLKPQFEKLGYTCIRSQAQPSNIISEVLNELFAASLVLAVLTDHNANVWYELGIRHVLSRGTIMIMEKAQHLPFDISHYGVLTYEDSITAALEFEEKLKQFVERIERDRPADGPVNDFLGPEISATLDKRRQELGRVPQEKRDEIEKALQEHPQPPSVQPEIKRTPAKILWVDDNPANNQAMIDHYRPLGISFDLALDTKQALDFLAQSEYALIISDIARGSDWEAGIHMIPQIRSRFPKAPPILIFAHPKAVEAHAEKARNLGASLITTSPRELIPWLDKVLRD